MKKALLISMLLVAALSAKAQRGHYYYKNQKRAVTYQVVPTIMNFEGTKFGFGIGANIKEVVSINYFHVRDYDFSETFMDNRFAGIHINAVVPVVDNIELGGGVRYGTLNTEWQKPLVSGELRLRCNDAIKLSFEYGKSDGRTGSSIRLLFNLY